jgi:hypothetical protein
MALRVARGLFRLWLLLSVLWIGGVGAVTWWTFPVTPEWAIVCERPATEPSEDVGCSWLEWVKAQVTDKEQRAAIRFASVLALIPPPLLLALGSALVWAFRGFRN